MDDRSSDSDLSVAETRPSEQVLEGIGVAPGIAIGTVHRYQVDPPAVTRKHIDPEETDDELSLLSGALERAEDELSNVRSVAQQRLGEESESILAAQEMMVQDGEVRRAVRQRIEEHHETAAYALSNVLQQHRGRLETSDDDYLRDRVNDLEELEMHLLQSLQRGKAAATIQPNSIVVAEQLTAADVIRFSRSGMLGFVTARGGETSHVSIIARALGVPAVTGAEEAADLVSDHDRVIVDGRQGRIIVHPSAATLDEYRQRRAQYQSLIEEQVSRLDGPTRTVDGHAVTLQANVDFEATLDTLERFGAEGIGLMRTEVLFLSGSRRSLGEDKQVDVYRNAARATGEHGATIRVFDLGGDKLLPLGQREENPFLGWRGIRFLLDQADETLRPQIRALLRANQYGSLRLLLPMVTHLDEVHRVRGLVDKEADRLSERDIEHDSDLPIGVMVEVPAVAVQAEKFADVADFLSIGTNDLTQYVLAVDRGNDRVADRYDALHPAVLKLVQQTVEAGRAMDTRVSLCGEVANDVSAVPILLGLGIETLSVSPPFLPTVKHVVSRVDRSEAQALAKEVVDAPDAGTVRRRARTWCDHHIDSDVLREPEGSE